MIYLCPQTFHEGRAGIPGVDSRSVYRWILLDLAWLQPGRCQSGGAW
mgnify:CR=1 FL=1